MFEYKNFSKGWKDYFSGVFMKDCPFDIDTQDGLNWQQGWIAACKTGI